MNNNEPDYKDNLVFDTKKSKNKDWLIEDFTELIMPEFITTSKEIHHNLQKAYETKRRLDDYIFNCCKKLAQIEKKQLVSKISRPYDVVIEEYHVVNVDEPICEDTCIGDRIVDEGYAEYDGTDEVLEDYTNE